MLRYAPLKLLLFQISMHDLNYSVLSEFCDLNLQKVPDTEDEAIKKGVPRIKDGCNGIETNLFGILLLHFL